MCPVLLPVLAQRHSSAPSRRNTGPSAIPSALQAGLVLAFAPSVAPSSSPSVEASSSPSTDPSISAWLSPAQQWPAVGRGTAPSTAQRFSTGAAQCHPVRSLASSSVFRQRRPAALPAPTVPSLSPTAGEAPSEPSSSPSVECSTGASLVQPQVLVQVHLPVSSLGFPRAARAHFPLVYRARRR
jgi:hypothetical protein